MLPSALQSTSAKATRRARREFGQRWLMRLAAHGAGELGPQRAGPDSLPGAPGHFAARPLVAEPEQHSNRRDAKDAEKTDKLHLCPAIAQHGTRAARKLPQGRETAEDIEQQQPHPRACGVRRIPPLSKARECRALQTLRAVRLRPCCFVAFASLRFENDVPGPSVIPELERRVVLDGQAPSTPALRIDTLVGVVVAAPATAGRRWQPVPGPCRPRCINAMVVADPVNLELDLVADLVAQQRLGDR